MVKIAVAGNLYLDAYLKGDVIEHDDFVILSSIGLEAKIHILDPPINQGFKHETGIDIEKRIRGMNYELLPGGGGFNTVYSIRKLNGAMDLSYIDVSSPEPIATKELEDSNIDHLFLDLRRPTTNIILCSEYDRTILKGCKFPTGEFEYGHEEDIREKIQGADAIAINSIRDESFAETLLRHSSNIPKYIMITKSLPQDFVRERMLQHGNIFFSCEDFAAFNNYNPLELGKEDFSELSLQNMQKMVSDRIVPRGKLFFITLGSNGVLCADNDGIIYNIRLEDKYRAELNNSARQNPKSTNGAGDFFAGAAIISDIGRASAIDTAIYASIAATRHIGYQGHMKKSYFIIKPCKHS